MPFACDPLQAKKDKAAGAADLVANMIFGELQGPKAGPLRWAFNSKILLNIWEWKSFRAAMWQGAILEALAHRTADEYGNEKVHIRLRNLLWRSCCMHRYTFNQCASTSYCAAHVENAGSLEPGTVILCR